MGAVLAEGRRAWIIGRSRRWRGGRWCCLRRGWTRCWRRGILARMLDEILARIDWSPWEAGYDRTRGQPPIHPRVLAGVILYGLLTRIRSSRVLEEALSVRLDFRWLAEGRSIDHTTLSTFRKQHPEALKNLFVQIGLVAREF